jgi:hypothetical protein
MRVVFRLPLRWKEGVQHRTVGVLEAGASVTIETTLIERPDPGHYLDGSEYDVAQLDFRADKRVRWFAVCESKNETPAPYFTRNGFLCLGPLAGDMPDFNPEKYAAAFLKGMKPAGEYTVPWGAKLVWKSLEESQTAFLDPDLIPTTAKSATPDFYQWDSTLYFPHQKIHYMLWGRVFSPRDKTVKAFFIPNGVKRLSLNGRAVEGGELHLKKGINDLRILYSPPVNPYSQFSDGAYGCYFRLAEPDGKRPTDLHFERPEKP